MHMIVGAGRQWCTFGVYWLFTALCKSHSCPGQQLCVEMLQFAGDFTYLRKCYCPNGKLPLVDGSCDGAYNYLTIPLR